MAVAALYGLISGLFGNLLAAILAVTTGRQANRTIVGTALGASAGFILGAAFLGLFPEAWSRSHSEIIVGAGIALGLLLMIGLGLGLGVFGVHEADPPTATIPAVASSERLRSGRLIALGIGIHNIPEALPIGAALIISPRLSLLVALVMIIENFAESGAIASELLLGGASAGSLIWETTWPGLLSTIGAPLGVIVAGISPEFLAFTLSLAVGIMLFIGGDVWGDSRDDAGVVWSSAGLLVGVLLAMVTAQTGPS
jgi:ZIP family zinc transporter